MELKTEATPETTEVKTFTVPKSGMYRLFNNRFVYLDEGVSYTMEQVMELPSTAGPNRAQRRAMDRQKRSKKNRS